jgi:hypothetical protein
MTWLYALQFALPLMLMLIGWLAWLPARSGLGFGVQVVGSFSAPAVMALQGIWLLPPWWAPCVFAVGLGVAAWLGWRGEPRPIQFNGRFPVRDDRIEAP